MRRKEKKRKEKRGKGRADIFEGLFTARYREMLWGDGRRKRGRLSLKYWRSRRWAIGLVMAIGLAVAIGWLWLLVVMRWNCQLVVGRIMRSVCTTRCPPCVAIQIAKLLSPSSMWPRHRKPVEVPPAHLLMIVGLELPCITLAALVKDAKFVPFRGP